MHDETPWVVWFCVPADMSETRDLREIAFDSEVVWSSHDGFEPLGESPRSSTG